VVQAPQASRDDGIVEPSPYEPEADDIVAHCSDGRQGVGLTRDAYFSLGTNYGAGKPHYYVCLDENGGERSWWLDPDQAEALGRKLVEYGANCRHLNAETDQCLEMSGEEQAD
jgi:hypothetical protein